MLNRIRYLWNVVTFTKQTMCNTGAREENCPHCGRVTPIYHHQGSKNAKCLWCGKDISECYCQICGGPFEAREFPCVDYGLVIYGGAHRNCLENLKKSPVYKK